MSYGLLLKQAVIALLFELIEHALNTREGTDEKLCFNGSCIVYVYKCDV